jgi:hypothetical protein
MYMYFYFSNMTFDCKNLLTFQLLCLFLGNESLCFVIIPTKCDNVGNIEEKFGGKRVVLFFAQNCRSHDQEYLTEAAN